MEIPALDNIANGSQQAAVLLPAADFVPICGNAITEITRPGETPARDSWRASISSMTWENGLPSNL